MALKDKIKFDMLVDPDDLSTVIFSPVNDKILNDSKYMINIKNLEFEDGTTYSNKEAFYTTPSNYYFVPIGDVKDLIHGLNLDDENIIHHIIDASKTAMYWAKRKTEGNIPDFNSETFQEDYYPFYMFIKTSAAVESLKEFYISAMAQPKKWRDVLSDLEREEEMDYDGIKGLIDSLEAEAEEWINLVVTITADPKWALRGKYCYSTYNTYTNPYHRIHWGLPPHNSSYNRGY